MVTQRSEFLPRKAGVIITGGIPVNLPVDLSQWSGRSALLRAVEDAAARACGDSWLNLVREESNSRGPDHLLILIAYGYLQGIYHSIDLLRRLDTDEHLAGLRGQIAVRPEQIRRFRREHRRRLTDCLTHALVTLWKQRHPAALETNLLADRIDFSFLEPFYLHAQDRIDRAVLLDSMALDY